jgi:hypothetical protein
MVEWFEGIINFTTLIHNAYKTRAVILTTSLEMGVKFLINCSGLSQHKCFPLFPVKNPSQSINLIMYVQSLYKIILQWVFYHLYYIA